MWHWNIWSMTVPLPDVKCWYNVGLLLGWVYWNDWQMLSSVALALFASFSCKGHQAIVSSFHSQIVFTEHWGPLSLLPCLSNSTVTLSVPGDFHPLRLSSGPSASSRRTGRSAVAPVVVWLFWRILAGHCTDRNSIQSVCYRSISKFFVGRYPLLCSMAEVLCQPV